jgi:putative transcriptional regulator
MFYPPHIRFPNIYYILHKSANPFKSSPQQIYKNISILIFSEALAVSYMTPGNTISYYLTKSITSTLAILTSILDIYNSICYHSIKEVDSLDENIQLKNRLKVARAEKNLSQEQLAILAGVTRQTISSIETGQYCPTAKLALILAKVLNKKFEDLFYFEEGKNNE